MTSRALADLCPQTQAKVSRLLASLAAAGLAVFVTSTYRSFAEQASLYAQGRTAGGHVVTNAKPGASFHNVRRAVDFAFSGPEPFADHHPWEELGAEIEAHGLTWGGRWRNMPDRPHAEDRWCAHCGIEHASALRFAESGECRRGL